MRTRVLLLLVVGVVLGPLRLQAQDSTLVLPPVDAHRDTIQAFQPQPYRLRPFLLPGSETIRVGRTPLDTSQYRLDARRGRLWITRDAPLASTDTVFAVYRTYPLDLQDVYRRRGVDTRAPSDTAGVALVEPEAPPDTGRFDPFENVTLERSGSISRGIIGGSNRDVNIESGLRMQLNGALAEDVRVRAVLTDENTPIQPSGTTQRLDDFDRVFVELDTPQGAAQLGDVDVNLGASTFARFDRKLQGVQIRSDQIGRALGIADGSARAVGAVSRGIYRTQDLSPTDGVQGPYRLQGRNGEEPIVVIAGSERVYLDGQRMERGRTNDYVIDYARGEVTFTPRHIITDERRITVEFQYTTSQFTRSLLASEATAGFWRTGAGEAPRATIGATVIREADGDNFQSSFNLSEQDLQRLSRAGDEEVFRSGARRVEFDPEAPFIQYRRTVRTASNGAQDTVFVALDSAPEPGTAVFRVRFTRVGAADGSYVRVGRQENGILYEYRGPGQGPYAPVIPLPQPKKRQVFDLRGSVKPVQGLTISGEWARSTNDANRFSDRDSGNDQDDALEATARLAPTEVRVGGVNLGRLSAEYRRRQRGEHFEPFNPTRDIDFGRRWNLSRRGSDVTADLQNAGDETIDALRVTHALGDSSRLEGALGRLQIGSAFDSWRRRGALSIQEQNGPRVTAQTEYVTSTNRLDGSDGAWLRQRGTIRQPLWAGAVEPAVTVERERRRQRALGTDSLTRASFAFLKIRPRLRLHTGDLTASGSVEYRSSEGALDGRFRNESDAWTVRSDVDYDPRAPYHVSSSVGYRVREFTDPFRRRRQARDNETVLLQFDAGAQPLDRAVDWSWFYDAVTERTPTLQEVFVRTGPELGQFVWTDTNGDGIQQVDEFVPETTPNEGEYVQSFVPSDSLESVIDVQARTRLRLDPARRWRSASAWWKQWLSTVSTQTTVEVQEESRSDDLASIYLLDLSRFRAPGTTLDGRLRLAQEVQLFRASNRYGLTLDWQQSRGLTERAAGAEAQFLNRWSAEGRWRLAPGWTVRTGATRSTDRTTSEAFADARSFDIATWELRPAVVYQPLSALQLSLTGAYARKTDDVGNRSARVLKLPLEATWSRAGRFRLNGTFEVADVSLQGDAVGLARFELTDGRGPGTSALWNLQLRYVINEFLRANVSYDGRAPANAPVIHTVRAQLNASF